MGKVSVTLMGLSGHGRSLLAMLAAHERFELVAVAERDPNLLASVGDLPGCELYDDYRQLVVQSPSELVVVAAPPFASNEHAMLAAKKGSHIWRMSPLARGFEPAVSLVKAVAKADRLLVAGSGWQRSRGWRTLQERLETLGTLYSVRVTRVVSLKGQGLGWRGDSVRAGGGVLLNLGYEPVAQILALLGRPGSVMASGSQLAGGSHAPNYDTEDAAVAMLRYPRNALGVVTTSWMSQPAESTVMVHGSAGSARIDGEGLRMWDDLGQTTVTSAMGDEGMADQLDAIVDAITGEQVYDGPTPNDHLEIMATLEAAYLSMRTGQSEATASVLSLHGLGRVATECSSGKGTGTEPRRKD